VFTYVDKKLTWNTHIEIRAKLHFPPDDPNGKTDCIEDVI